jgi:hypothetical protein
MLRELSFMGMGLLSQETTGNGRKEPNGAEIEIG